MATVTLKVKNGNLVGKEFTFASWGDWTIGRADDCQLRLPTDLAHISISRHHCTVHIRPPRIWVRDLRSRNGTRINGMQIGHPAAWPSVNGDDLTPLSSYELHNGDELEVAGMVFEVTIKPSVGTKQQSNHAEAGPGQSLDAVSSSMAMST